MNIIYWLFLAGYFSSLCALMGFIGINWKTLAYKYKYNPQRVIIVVYVLNFFVLMLLFRLPFTIQLIFNTLLIGALYLGTQFQVIGLTGGIATGKSTVSAVLADNGFGVICADKISKNVCMHSYDDYS